MRIDLVTIFPGIFKGPFKESMISRAVEQGFVEINVVDLREYTHDRHRKVDDTPYGGGHGMIMKPEPVFEAVDDLRAKAAAGGTANTEVILLTPQGKRFSQDRAIKFSEKKHLVLICGRYEGVDERVRTGLVDEEISIGDYVLTGGELAAAVVVDAVVRLLPGFLAAEVSADESFAGCLLEYPHYTRPPVYRDMEVPSVLLSGHHAQIARWRRCQSLARTWERRPDLLEKAELEAEDLAVLEKIKNSGSCE